MSFSYDYTTYDNDGTVDQGTLASSYTNALSAYLQSDGADYVAFLSYVAGGSIDVDAALALKAEVEAGNFSLSGLFAAAQSKTGEVDGIAITNPTPMLTVTFADGTTANINLTGMLTDLDTETWTTLTQVKKTTSTIYHTREFYSESMTPTDYDVNWSVENQPPTAEEIVWGVSEYDDVANTGEKSSTIDLLVDAKAEDPDGGDTLSVTFDESQLPDYVTYADGKLTIDTDSPLLDYLPKGETLKLSFTYQISDGTVSIDNTVSLTITGTNDVAKISGTATGQVTEDGTTVITGVSLTVDDPDAGESSFQEVTDLNGTYGSFSFEDGEWGYTLDNDSDLVQALKYYQTGSDTLTVTSFDGTATEEIEVTIQGTADKYTGTASTTVSPTGTVGNNNTTWDGTFSFDVTSPDSQAFGFNYSGTATVTVTGDLDNDHTQAARDEKIAVTVENSTLTFAGTETDATNQEPGGTGYVATEKTGSTSYSSTDATISGTYDSTTSTGDNGVDDIDSIAISVTYTYWV